MPRCAICKKANSVGNGGLKCKCKGKKMKVEIDLPEIDGFQYTGEYRSVKYGERYLFYTSYMSEWKNKEESHHKFHILIPTEKWITPTLEYMQEHYKWGEEIPCRVRDYNHHEWSDYILKSIKEGEFPYVCLCGEDYKYCEIKEKR
jgi:hypothetical protein